jgi:hypothetical protein
MFQRSGADLAGRCIGGIFPAGRAAVDFTAIASPEIA